MTTPAGTLSAEVTGDAYKLQTVTKDGDPVPERVLSIKAARSLYQKTYYRWLPVAKRRSRLKGLVDGNPPFEPQRLVELGLAYMTNVNFLEARSIADQSAGAFFELFHEVPTLVEVKQQFGADPQNPTVDYSSIVAEEFTTMVHDWRGFLLNMLKARREADIGGFGPVLWRDEWDWRFKAFSAANFLCEPTAELDVDGFGFFFMRDRMTASDLYGMALESESRAASEGWDVEAVKKALVDVYVKEAQQSLAEQQFQATTWESIQQRIRNNDYWTQSVEFEYVRVVHMLVKEMKTGKVSHYIFTEKQFGAEAVPMPPATPNGTNVQTAPPKEDEDRFLFRCVERFDKMSNALWMLYYNDGDGYLRSVRGLVSSIEPHCDLSNRFLGRVFDAGFLTSSMVLQPATQADASRIQMVRAGMITVVPAGLNIVQSSFQPQINPLIQLRELSSSIMRNNTGVFRTSPETIANEATKTARQVAYEEGREARLEKSSVAFDYTQLDLLYKEMFRRATNKDYLLAKAKYPGQIEARQFLARCLIRGVPETLIYTPGMFSVTATRAIGLGSWGVKMDLTNQILNARGMMDSVGARNALRDWLSVRAGYRNVDRYATMSDRNQTPSNDTSVATLENNDFAQGQAVPAGSDQMHMIHLLCHAAPVAQVVQAFQQTRGMQMDISSAMRMLAQALPHMEQHVQYLAQDPARQDFVKQMAALLKAGTDTYTAMSKLVMQHQDMQAIQQRQQLQGQIDQQKQLQEAQQAAAMTENDKKMQLEAMKQESLNEMRRVKTEEQLAIRRQMAAADIQLKAQKAQASIELDSKKTDADIAIRQAQAEKGV